MQQRISVFDMMKIGVGPSSSHTMGPWRAATRFMKELQIGRSFDSLERVIVELFGSLAKTGRGHGTDIAVLMGLRGENPALCDTSQIDNTVASIKSSKTIHLLQEKNLPFDYDSDLIFHFDQSLPFHPNGIRFTAELDNGAQIQATYFSVGGGFITQEGETHSELEATLPYPCDFASEVQATCEKYHLAIWQMVWENEMAWRTEKSIRLGLLQIWETMRDCIYRGCHTQGHLPGGLNVKRRAYEMHQKLLGEAHYSNPQEWMACIKAKDYKFYEVVKWISCFALAVNEENAAFGRVVTAPTNGAAGVLPAVLMYYVCFNAVDEDKILRFLMVAGEVGTLFKKGATISAAMGGCQAEIGVSSAMAAAALTESLGGTVQQSLMAAEIAMEHHLGLTCDPIGGLVQIPCIERNAMGAIKAITASNIALESNPQHAKVSLDAVIKTMWQTALDMNEKYKETSEGGLAVNIPVNVIEC
jgi:L-serine dehydratase